MKEGSLLHKISLAVLPRLGAWLIKAWFSTCRITEHGADYRKQCKEHDNPVIATFWHFAILYPFYHMRKESGVAMVSASKDGEYISRLASHFGFVSVRGSRNKRGTRATKELLKFLGEGRHAALVADGSQGPALKVQPGSIFLAAKSGAPILPITWSASGYWTIRSWDRLAIPKPFSRIEFFYGKPVLVPPDVKADGIEEYRRQLENNLDEIYRSSWRHFGKEQH